MASSGAVWAIIAGSVAQGWGLYVFLTCLPTYMKEILRFDIKTVRNVLQPNLLAARLLFIVDKAFLIVLSVFFIDVDDAVSLLLLFVVVGGGGGGGVVVNAVVGFLLIVIFKPTLCSLFGHIKEISPVTPSFIAALSQLLSFIFILKGINLYDGLNVTTASRIFDSYLTFPQCVAFLLPYRCLSFQNASLSAIPYALSWMTKVTGGQMADVIRKNGYLSTKNTRKLFASLGEKENGCCLIGRLGMFRRF